MFYNEFGCSHFKSIKQKLTFGTKILCFIMILDAFLLESCSGGPRRLWRSGSALAELWEALGELWEALYIEKLPINRPSGRYVII